MDSSQGIKNNLGWLVSQGTLLTLRVDVVGNCRDAFWELDRVRYKLPRPAIPLSERPAVIDVNVPTSLR